MSNEWYEKGELPPVGAHCECTLDKGVNWYECVILPHDMIARNCVGQFWDIYDISETYKFRPIQSERDKLIEEATKIVDDLLMVNDCIDSFHVAEKIVGAGWRPKGD